MQIRFHDTRPADAPAAVLFEVITDYVAYPLFNSAVIDVRIVRKDEAGAEFVATRKTRIGSRHSRANAFVTPRYASRNSTAHHDAVAITRCATTLNARHGDQSIHHYTGPHQGG